MANNRIYMRCKGCGETLYLGKHFMDNYLYEDYGRKPLKELLNNFYANHDWCKEGFNAFELVYENDLDNQEYMKEDNEWYVFKEGGLIRSDKE